MPLYDSRIILVIYVAIAVNLTKLNTQSFSVYEKINKQNSRKSAQYLVNLVITLDYSCMSIQFMYVLRIRKI